MAIGPVVTSGSGAALRRFLAEDPAVELRRLDRAMITMRRDLDSLIETGLPAGRGAARGAGSHAPGGGR